ncbi:hypothetical protein TNCV_3202661 [Trichonephila clavipes]|nr:hypothetical protein TNCV_3202661 [Trichonephila clavipes]
MHRKIGRTTDAEVILEMVVDQLLRSIRVVGCSLGVPQSPSWWMQKGEMLCQVPFSPILGSDCITFSRTSLKGFTEECSTSSEDPCYFIQEERHFVEVEFPNRGIKLISPLYNPLNPPDVRCLDF